MDRKQPDLTLLEIQARLAEAKVVLSRRGGNKAVTADVFCVQLQTGLINSALAAM